MIHSIAEDYKQDLLSQNEDAFADEYDVDNVISDAEIEGEQVLKDLMPGSTYRLDLSDDREEWVAKIQSDEDEFYRNEEISGGSQLRDIGNAVNRQEDINREIDDLFDQDGCDD